MVEVIQGNVCERLYLQKQGSHEVFLNNCQLLKQHQINGLRCLYMQFKKKKQGVILNFPTHTGKSVTVVLFVNAVIYLLKKPVLILCKNDNEMFTWKEYFLQWTDFIEDDLAVESKRVVKGKKIFIKKVDELAYYRHHSWSIVIAKHDLIDKDMCQISDAEYKIWITSTDMKKDLKMLAFIYDWLYPKLKLNVKDFIPSEKTSKEILLKSIYLDAFLEDIVIREDNVKQFDEIKESKTSSNIANVSETRVKKSRKNKDATGTKVKRSRRIIDDDDDDKTILNENETTSTRISIINENFAFETDEQNVNEGNNVFVNDLNNDMSTVYAPSDINFMEQNLSTGIKTNLEANMEIDSMETMDFGDAINEIVRNENIMQPENSTESIYSEEIGNETNVNLENEKESLKVDNNGMEQGTLNDPIDILKSEQNVDGKEDCKEIVKNEEVSDLDETNGGKTFNNYIDTKLTELEERTMKKFKGSFLDSIF
ncbi:uncharacterized protein LOC123657109 [Melitaea cinxia]|uniref:uncharacterized protein LOC123657109 n=1 Tax=Melitaea cinxia TaxID=113334 RepID=UPI001E2708EC|nr:uncharacterized protein LOC123657109 [Melitaea cinxia]